MQAKVLAGFEYDIHHNPFPSDGSGNYEPAGAFETYELLIYSHPWWVYHFVPTNPSNMATTAGVTIPPPLPV